MGGTQRVAKFVKYLPEFGWQPVVVTVKNISYYAEDLSLLQDVRGAPVRRTGSLDPQRLLKLFSNVRPPRQKVIRSKESSWTHKVNRLLSWVLLPDTKLLWQPFAYKAAMDILRAGKIDCLLTTSPPHSVHLAGSLLHKTYKIPWVADFRDGWASGNFQYEPTKLHRRLNELLETRVLKQADQVISVSEPLTEKLRQHNFENSERFHTITNGFDWQDFPAQKPQFGEDVFTITYSGAMSNIAPLQGFFTALSELLKSQPDLRKKLGVRLVGLDMEGQVQRFVTDAGLKDLVTFCGYRPHGEAVDFLLKSHLLLYPVADWASDDFVPGKTFEYMAAQKPVLALGPNVEGVRLLKNVADVEHAGHKDISKIVDLLKARIEADWGMSQNSPDRKTLEIFERKMLTRKLAGILDAAIS